MQAITLWQPWATLIALGVKRIETRSWPAPVGVAQRSTQAPGVWVWRKHGLAIHAARHTPGRDMAEAWANPWIRDTLALWGITRDNWTGGPGSLPQGAIVAVVTLKACLPMEPGGGLVGLCEQEAAFGNYSPGRWAWLLADVVNLNDRPQAAQGHQRIWTVPDRVVENVKLAADSLGRPLARP